MPSKDVIPREQAIRNARAVLDRALDRIARDRAEGRLTPEAEARIALAEQAYGERAVAKEQACANARILFDQARARRDADYAAGRLAGSQLAAFEQLLTDIALALQADATAPTPEEGLHRAEDVSGRAFSRDTLDRLACERAESVWQPKIIAYMDSVAPLPERRRGADE